MKNDPKNKNGLHGKLNKGVGSHKVGQFIKYPLTEKRCQVDGQMNNQKNN